MYWLGYNELMVSRKVVQTWKGHSLGKPLLEEIHVSDFLLTLEISRLRNSVQSDYLLKELLNKFCCTVREGEGGQMGGRDKVLRVQLQSPHVKLDLLELCACRAIVFFADRL